MFATLWQEMAGWFFGEWFFITRGSKPQRPGKVSGTRVNSTSGLQGMGYTHTHTHTHTECFICMCVYIYIYIYHLLLYVLLLLMLNSIIIQNTPLMGFVVAFCVVAVGCFVVKNNVLRKFNWRFEELMRKKWFVVIRRKPPKTMCDWRLLKSQYCQLSSLWTGWKWSAKSQEV